MRNFPQAVVHGLYNKQGLQFPNLHMEQMVQQIMMLLLHNKDMNNPIGVLINANCKVLRLEMGIMGNIFDIPAVCKNMITESWIKKVWTECHKHNITIQSKISNLNPPRRGDCKIMRKIIQAGYKNQELMTLNRCRMWLRVTFLSDIYNGFGNQIKTNCWEGLEPAKSDLEWPRMEKPTQAEWQEWQRALTEVIHLKNNASPQLN